MQTLMGDKVRGAWTVARVAAAVFLAVSLQLGCGDDDGGGSSQGEPVRALPAVVTEGPGEITTASVTLHGTINPNGSAASGWFEWGTDATLSDPSETEPIPLGAGDTDLAFSAELTGLTPGVTYFFRAAGATTAGTVSGAVDFFATRPESNAALEVNCVLDEDPPPAGKVTLREAVARVDAGGIITFHPMLDDTTIRLRLVGEEHSVLKGEVFTMGAGGWLFQGFQERDYGRSALYARKSLTIDASGLPEGITIAWEGGDEDRARVLAVYGDLTLRHATIASGRANAEPLADGPQPYTLARGAGSPFGGAPLWSAAP